MPAGRRKLPPAQTPYFPQGGGQGKLFSETPYIAAQHRYPRGYTPERMGEVRSALAGVVDRPTLPASRSHPFDEPHHERLVQEAVARSTVPTSHLEGLQRIHLRGPTSLIAGAVEGGHGLYSPSSKTIRIFGQKAKRPKRGPEAGQTLIEPITGASRRFQYSGVYGPRKATIEDLVPKEQLRNEAAATLIHELGHHVSFRAGHTQAGPEEEGRADRYMTEHFRADPRSRREHFDVGAQTYQARLGNMGSSYRAGFEAPPVEPKPKRRRRS